MDTIEQFGDLPVDEAFANWAKGFSGCDGGNPHGAVWFCGIEYGAGPGETLPDGGCVDRPDTVNDDNCGGDRMRFINQHQFNRKLAKLYAAMIDWRGRGYKDCFRDTAMFGSREEGSDTFKANLYPMGFRHADGGWTRAHYERTGLPTKELYRGWCQTRRFAVIRQWTQQTYRPSVIVCLGRGSRDEFVLCFDGQEGVFSEDNVVPIGSRHELCWRTTGATRQLLFVLPFLGQGGLMSDADIAEAGRTIDSVAREYIGPAWCRRNWE